jgi:hypothetical protein
VAVEHGDQKRRSASLEKRDRGASTTDTFRWGKMYSQAQREVVKKEPFKYGCTNADAFSCVGE